MEELTPVQAKRIRVISELRCAVTADRDHIGLYGHQPSLRKIRVAYQTDKITNEELELVLSALYNETGGEPEPFKDAKDFYAKYFADIPKSTPKPTVIPSLMEQAEIIKGIMPEKKKYTGPRKKQAPKEVKIDISALPPELRQYLK